MSVRGRRAHARLDDVRALGGEAQPARAHGRPAGVGGLAGLGAGQREVDVRPCRGRGSSCAAVAKRSAGAERCGPSGPRSRSRRPCRRRRSCSVVPACATKRTDCSRRAHPHAVRTASRRWRRPPAARRRRCRCRRRAACRDSRRCRSRRARCGRRSTRTTGCARRCDRRGRARRARGSLRRGSCCRSRMRSCRRRAVEAVVGRRQRQRHRRAPVVAPWTSAAMR